MDRLVLTTLASGGLLSVGMAEGAGVDRRELAAAARAGAVTRVCRGWYSLRTRLDPEELHALRVTALALDHPDWVASHHSALVVRGIPTYRNPLRIARFVSTNEPGRTPAGVRVLPRSSVHVEEVAVGPHVVPCLPVATSVVQAGIVASAVSALVSADAALAAGQTTTEAIAAAVADAAGQRGIREIRRVLMWADPRHESPGESRMCHSLRCLGHDHEPQVWIGRDRVDALLREAPVVLEFDGAVKYGTREDLVREKRREDRIRSQGYEFVRCDWNDVDDLPALDRAIQLAIRRSARAA